MGLCFRRASRPGLTQGEGLRTGPWLTPAPTVELGFQGWIVVLSQSLSPNSLIKGTRSALKWALQLLKVSEKQRPVVGGFALVAIQALKRNIRRRSAEAH